VMFFFQAEDGIRDYKVTGVQTVLFRSVISYKGFVREVIEDGRRSFRARLKEMTVPGRYRAPAFIELPFAKESQLPSYARRDTMRSEERRVGRGVVTRRRAARGGHDGVG